MSSQTSTFYSVTTAAARGALSRPAYRYAVQTGLPTFDHEDVAAIYRRLSESRSIRTVIVAGLWAEMFKSADPRSVEDELSKGIQILIDAGKKVYLMSDNPRFPFSPRPGNASVA